MSAESSKPFHLSYIPRYLQEDLSQECQDLIATLPAEASWYPTGLYLYEGYWLGKRPLQGILNCQKHFQAHDSDVLLVSSPKSGTTWLQALLFTILNRKTYNPKLCLDLNQMHPLLTTNPHALVPSLEQHIYLRENKPDLTSFSSPRLFSTHMSYISLPESVKQSRCKIVYLCRNPKDLIVSMWHFASNLIPKFSGSTSIEDAVDMFCRGVSPFGPFWDHVLGYYKESLERPKKIMFLRYEELKGEPERVLRDVAEFIGYGFSEKEESGDVVGDILGLCSFKNLSNLEVNKSAKLPYEFENKFFFRRGEVGDWKNFLTFDMIERIDVITQEKLGKYGLKF